MALDSKLESKWKTNAKVHYFDCVWQWYVVRVYHWRSTIISEESISSKASSDVLLYNSKRSLRWPCVLQSQCTWRRRCRRYHHLSTSTSLCRHLRITYRPTLSHIMYIYLGFSFLIGHIYCFTGSLAHCSPVKRYTLEWSVRFCVCMTVCCVDAIRASKQTYDDVIEIVLAWLYTCRFGHRGSSTIITICTVTHNSRVCVCVVCRSVEGGRQYHMHRYLLPEPMHAYTSRISAIRMEPGSRLSVFALVRLLTDSSRGPISIPNKLNETIFLDLSFGLRSLCWPQPVSVQIESIWYRIFMHHTFAEDQRPASNDFIRRVLNRAESRWAAEWSRNDSGPGQCHSYIYGWVKVSEYLCLTEPTMPNDETQRHFTTATNFTLFAHSFRSTTVLSNRIVVRRTEPVMR